MRIRSQRRFLRSITEKQDDFGEQKNPLCGQNLAFHLSNKTVVESKGTFCSRKMAPDPKLLPDRKELPEDIRTQESTPGSNPEGSPEN